MNAEAILNNKGYQIGKFIFQFLYNRLKVFFNKMTNDAKSLTRKNSGPFLLVLFFPFIVFILMFLPEIMPGLVIPLFASQGPAVQSFDVYSIGENQDKLEKQIQATNWKIAAVVPHSFYLIINSSANQFKLFKHDKLIRSGLCSTGSYIKLEAENNQEWIFRTPRGEYKILGKMVDPVWRRPDWAFFEEGLPVPSPNHSSRFEYGVLGDYALSLGNGYLIHGTLYQRFLGLPVTHGCVRLNDADLKAVYNSLGIGSRVFIY